jgi:hypothetical protein
LFIPDVIYEHGEPWRNDADKGKLTILPPELSGKPANSHIVEKQKGLASKNALRSISIIEEFFGMQENLPTWGRRLYVPSE